MLSLTVCRRGAEAWRGKGTLLRSPRRGKWPGPRTRLAPPLGGQEVESGWVPGREREVVPAREVLGGRSPQPLGPQAGNSLLFKNS